MTPPSIKEAEIPTRARENAPDKAALLESENDLMSFARPPDAYDMPKVYSKLE